MRSLWTATTPLRVWCVFAGLAGCNYDNPGFKVKGSAEGSGASETSVGPTSMPVETQASGTPTTTTNEPVDTTSEPATSLTSLDTSASDVSTATTSEATTGGGEWVFPSECDQTIAGEFEKAAADTFFYYELPTGLCSFVMAGPNCINREFSQVDYEPLFHVLYSPGLEDDIVNMYAVRFAMPTPKYMGEVPVPLHAFQSLDARFHVFRPSPADPWKPVNLAVHRIATGDTWQEGQGQEFTPCKAPAPSFRCRVCPEGDAEDECKVPWKIKGAPVPLDAQPLQKLSINEEPGQNGADVQLETFAKADLGWLMAEGLVVMSQVELSMKMIEVKTLQAGEMAWMPAMRVNYCEPTFVLK